MEDAGWAHFHPATVHAGQANRKWGKGLCLSVVQGGFDRQAAALQDMGVDHGGADIFVTKQFLHGTDIIPILEQVGGKGVPEGMAGYTFAYSGCPGSFFDGAL